MTTVNLTNYSVDNRSYPELKDICIDDKIKTVVIIGGQKAMNAANRLIKESLEGSTIKILGEFIYGKDSTNSNIEILQNEKSIREADIIFGVGGGKAIDTAKVVADRLNKNIYTFPTICSNCSSATAIAVVYNDDGSLSHYEDKIRAPKHVFINTDILANAPEKYMWAGIGDGISKEPEVLYAMKNAKLNHIGKLAKAIASSCQDTFIEYGKKAIKDCQNNINSEAIEEVAMDIFINTGNVSNLTNREEFYFNSSLAHAFYNATCAIKRSGEFLHGQVVAFGVMVLHAYAGNDNELKKIAEFNKEVKLPTKLSDINLNYNDLDIIADEAMKTNEWKKALEEFSREKFIDSIKKADQYGRSLKVD